MTSMWVSLAAWRITEQCRLDDLPSCFSSNDEGWEALERPLRMMSGSIEHRCVSIEEHVSPLDAHVAPMGIV